MQGALCFLGIGMKFTYPEAELWLPTNLRVGFCGAYGFRVEF